MKLILAYKVLQDRVTYNMQRGSSLDRYHKYQRKTSQIVKVGFRADRVEPAVHIMHCIKENSSNCPLEK